jgi:diguanylate cyclase (GGDEF)-like protein
MKADYTPWLVCLSILVAILVSYTALGLAARVSESRGVARRVWLALGACSMGIGVWSMHFIGMLALSMPITLMYSVGITLASLAVAILTSGFAIHIASCPKLGTARHLVCSLVMGTGIVAMHYTGMSAIMVVPGIQYALLPVAMSVVIAVVASYAALWLTFRLRASRSRYASLARAGAAVIMGAAIAGMHYTGMAAAVFLPGSFCSGGIALDNSPVGIAIAVGTVGFLGVTIITGLVDAHMAARAKLYAASLASVDRALLHQATHDTLTGLPNRSHFLGSLRGALERVQTGQQASLAVLFLDLDRFKLINDTQGHDAGDELLRQIARRLTGELRNAEPHSVANGARTADVVGRFGGDEFLVLLNSLARPQDAKVVADRLLQTLLPAYDILGREVHCGASIGIVTDQTGAVTADEMVRNADVAMYEAKRHGRSRTVLFTQNMHNRVSRDVSIESGLRRAIGTSELQVVFQPIVEFATGRMVSVEALARWNHPTLGPIPPSEFIPIAEESGLIVPLGRWVCEEACRAMRLWHRISPGRAPLTVSVNVSRVELAQGEAFRTHLAKMLRSLGMPAHHLQLEVTERDVMRDPEASLHLMQYLKAIGIKLAMDDFGTGTSSLSILRTYPFDMVKIDRSFVPGIVDGADVRAVMHATIGLVERLGMSSLVEGIEEPAQHAVVRALGCRFGQGWLYGKPLQAQDVLAAADYLMANAQPGFMPAPLDDGASRLQDEGSSILDLALA